MCAEAEGLRERAVFKERQGLGWLRCGMPCGCRGAAKMRLERQVSMQLSTFFAHTTFLPTHPCNCVAGAKKDFHPPNS